MLTVFCKTPIYQLKPVEDLRRMLMVGGARLVWAGGGGGW
jgi:hypothetical protein